MTLHARLLVALLSVTGFASAANIRIVGLQPTVLFPNRDPICQVGWLEVENDTQQPIPCDALVKVDGRSGSAQRLTLPPGVSRQDILVPDRDQAAEIEIELRTGSDTEGTIRQRWEPQRKWKVFVVKSSHEDIGYENYLWVKQKEIADYIDYGRRLSVTGPLPAEEGARTPGGYHYWLETMLFPRYYEAERGEIALRELINTEVKPGLLPLGAAPNGAHTHWMDYEELARFMYPARRDYRDRFGIDLDTFAIVDNPSMSWSTCQAMASAGYRYAVRFGQPFRTNGNNDYRTTKLPAVFWWEAPDGHSRILYTWRNHYGINFWFGQTAGGYTDLTGLAANNVQSELAAVQSGDKLGPYAFDALLIPSYQDHEIPSWDNRALRHWQEVYRYPEIKIANPRDFMVYIEKNYGAQLPVLRGDLNNFSADYATIDPQGQEWKRRAARLVPLAEGVGVMAGLSDTSFALLPTAVEGAYSHMFDFDEHSWPTSPPMREVHQFNAQWGKHLEGGRALADAEELFHQSADALVAQIATGNARTLVVMNPLGHPRTDIVQVKEPIAGLVDPESGDMVPVQQGADGQSVFLARNVPAFGYKAYRFADSSPAAASALRTDRAALENEYYTVTFDPASGAVKSIIDRTLKRELVDPQAPYEFNQLVWVSKNSREGKAGTNYAPRTGATLTATRGPVFAEMTAAFHDVKLGDAEIRQTIRLYAGLRRIEVRNELRHVGALHSNRSADRYRNNIFFAFPIAVDHFTPRVEYAGGVVRPYDDQLRWGSHDFLAANRWVDVSNPAFGVTMAPINAPIVNFGAIRYNEFSIDYKPTSSALYSYAWSNRMDGLLALDADDMNANFAYVFTTHEGDWNSGATTGFGWAVGSPMETRIAAAGQTGPLPEKSCSFLSISAANVQATVVKETERPGNGWIVRLVETDGKAAETFLDVGRFPVDHAALCDLVENDLSPLEVRDGKVKVALPAFGFATVRLFHAAGAQTAPNPAMDTVTDDIAHLVWPAVGGARGYNVFRSVDPEAPATAHTFVGRTVKPQFRDAALNLDTLYYYRVAAFGTGNQEGSASPPVPVRTTLINKAPPQPVTQLGVVRLAHDRLMICWHKSPESDVARYLVYRSDHPGFSPVQTAPCAEVKPSGYYLEHFTDTQLKGGSTYYYQVVAEDWAGNRQNASATAAGTTPKSAP
jgi:alpha-mannosidase